MIDTTTQELSREQCMEILGWASYAGFSDEQLQAAVHNQRVRQRWGSQTTGREIGPLPTGEAK